MIIGLDFDNTITSYCKAIRVLAKRHLDIPSHVPMTKIGLRDYLRSQGREEEWTWFQGELYGPGMKYADVQESAHETMRNLKIAGHTLLIISHRTKAPAGGQNYNLHEYAETWIANRLNTTTVGGSILIDQIFFLPTQERKVEMISHLSCDCFVDDLPQVLLHPMFPLATKKVLYDKDRYHKANGQLYNTIFTWQELESVLGITEGPQSNKDSKN
jgi:hypothetical protein